MLVLPVTTTSPTPPTSPAAGDFWVNATTNRRYVWYVMDSGQGQWVQADVPMTEGTSAYYPGLVGPTTPGTEIVNNTPKITLAPQPPGNPAQGDLWWSTITGQQSVWYFDGNSYQWVISNYGGKEGPPGPPGAIGNIVAGPGLTGGGTTPVVNLAVDTTVIAPLDSPALTGTPTAPTPATADSGTTIPTTAFVHAAIAAIPPVDLSAYAKLANPVFTGNPQAPTPAPGDNSVAITTTAFVHAAIAAIPPPNLSAYAPLNSPTFTGDPKAPTPAPGDNDTSIPTTAWVNTTIAAIPPPNLSAYAPLASPVFTGDPRAPTPAPGDNDTSIPTTAWVHAAIAAIPPSSSINVGDTPPGSPSANALWWNSALGQMFIYYNDGNSTQWVPASPSLTTPPVLRGFIDGFQHVVPGGNQLYQVLGGMAADSANAVMINRTGTLAKTMAPWAQGNGNGSLDTGTVAASTWYNSYAIFNPTTGVVDQLTSLQPTNATPNGVPALPPGFTYYRLIGGCLVTDASSNLLGIVQTGDKVLWKVARGLGQISGPTIPSWTPPGRRSWILINAYIQAQNNGNSASMYFTDDGGPANGHTFAAAGFGTTTGVYVQSDILEILSSASQTTPLAAGGYVQAYAVTLLGYRDTRGKDQ